MKVRMSDTKLTYAFRLALDVSSITSYTAFVKFDHIDGFKLRLFSFMSNKSNEFEAINNDELDYIIGLMEELIDGDGLIIL